MKSLLTRFVKDESGATAIEYGLIAGFIAIVIVTAGPLINQSLAAIFQAIQGALQLAAANVP